VSNKKSRGYSIHIGLNDLQLHYPSLGLYPLKSCRNDAREMVKIAKDQGFNEMLIGERNIFLNDFQEANRATSQNVKKYFADAAKTMESGDILLITFSGHGVQVDELTNEKSITKELDGQNETWCLWNRPFFDIEIYECLTDFENGVTVIIVSDSCHSGTIVDFDAFGYTKEVRRMGKRDGIDFQNFEKRILNAKGFKYAEFTDLDEIKWKRNLEILQTNNEAKILRQKNQNENIFIRASQINFDNETLSKLPLLENVKTIPRDAFIKKYRESEIEFNNLRNDAITRLERKLIQRRNSGERLLRASVILLTACDDDESAIAGCKDSETSLFTRRLLEIWEHTESYTELHCSLVNYFGKFQIIDCDSEVLSSLVRHLEPRIDAYPKIKTNSLLGMKPFTV
jgi:Caspase domain